MLFYNYFMCVCIEGGGNYKESNKVGYILLHNWPQLAFVQQWSILISFKRGTNNCVSVWLDWIRSKMI